MPDAARFGVLAPCLVLGLALNPAAFAADAPDVRPGEPLAVLKGYAELPAGTLSPGPLSGQFINDVEGVTTPFQGQPVQGFSAVIPMEGGNLLALSDNGFGSRANSPDYLLRIYSLSPLLRTAAGGAGVVDVNGFITLNDEQARIEFPIVADGEYYSGNPGGISVDPDIRERRWLTGADFDPESLSPAADGGFWVGDEFGPWLLRFDAWGQLSEAPVALPGLMSPDRPDIEPGQETMGRSSGFEGMAVSPDGARLYPMLEKGLPDSPEIAFIYTYDTTQGRWLNENVNDPGYRYRLDDGATAVGEFVIFSGNRGLLLERDSAEGDEAVIKRVYAIDLDHLDEEGYLVKVLVADLLDIADPDDLDQDGNTRFRFPHWTIESIAVIDADRLLIVNDNNHPFGNARGGRESGKGPDLTEFILLGVQRLW